MGKYVLLMADVADSATVCSGWTTFNQFNYPVWVIFLINKPFCVFVVDQSVFSLLVSELKKKGRLYLVKHVAHVALLMQNFVFCVCF